MLAAVALPTHARVVWAGVLTAASAAAGGVAGIAVLTGSATFTAFYPDLLPLGGIRIEFDALSAIFTVAVAVVAVPASIYSIGYCRHGAASRPVQAAFPLLVWSLMMVPAAGNVAGLIVFWELMTASSFVLVLAEHQHSPEARTAAQWYAAMMHVSLVAIVLALFVLAHETGGDSFAAMRSGAHQVSPMAASVVFVLALLGFGTKAGVVPVHVWLPRAHPEAPSHASALMSGAMVKLGVYGVIRVGWDLLGGGPAWWGAVVLAIGLVSAMFGILHALVASDLKRLLAYSTTENVGLIFVGVGAAGLFRVDREPTVGDRCTGRGDAACDQPCGIQGSVVLGCRVDPHRDRDPRPRPPRGPCPTDAGHSSDLRNRGLGNRRASPLNGFVSEWLLLQSLVHSLPSSAVAVAVAMPIAVAVVALVGGLVVATFVKAFGTAFLAMPRSVGADQAHESPRSMQVGLVVLSGACIALALAPTMLAEPMQRVSNVVGGLADGRPIHTNGVYLQLSGIQAGLSPLLLATGLTVMMIAALAVVRRSRSRHTIRDIPAWGCGRTVQTARMEYTATSFAEPLQRVFDDVLHPEIDVDVDHRTESRHYVQAIRYRLHTRDAVEQRFYQPVLAAVRRWGNGARRIQNGSIHRYLTYSLVTLIVVLVVSR